MNPFAPEATPSVPSPPAEPFEWRSAALVRLGGGTFALDGGAVRHVSGSKRATRVPRTDPVLLGLVDVRGVIVPLVDLADLLGVDGAYAGDRDEASGAIVLVEHEDAGVAFRVESVDSFVTRSVRLDGAPDAGPFGLGRFRHDGGVVVALDTARVYAALRERVRVV